MLEIPFNNSYIDLGEKFYVKTQPIQVARPTLIRLNEDLATNLGILTDGPCSDEWQQFFSGNYLHPGSAPLAMAYAGHQFGNFVPQLGDGRAILLGEVRASDGASYGLQLKGSGRTFFSRDGDGRAALGPVLREYLVSEAMVKLGIPSTRALAVVTTGEEVARENLLPGGIITRVARSFVRVGTFEYFAARQDKEAIHQLARHVIEQNFPELAESTTAIPSFLQAVVDRQAALIARWMLVGFIHGVMNTDNMSIVGETIDYGPCAFMDMFNYEQVYSYIDRYGRYAYKNQPSIGLWNLTRFAETLLPILHDDLDEAVSIAKNVLESFIDSYQKHWLDGMQAKCGMSSITDDISDKLLLETLLDLMAQHQADYTLVFRRLSELDSVPSAKDDAFRCLFGSPVSVDHWLDKWRDRLSKESCSDQQRQTAMRAINPLYIPRNHQIELAIRAAEDRSDFSVFHELFEVLKNPYHEQAGKERFSLPPEPEEKVKYTFCGT